VNRTPGEISSMFLSRVQKVRATGDGKWEFCCPVHPDSKPSATATEGDRGLLLHCHACGADAPKIAAAVGLDVGDLFWASNGKRKSEQPPDNIVSSFAAQARAFVQQMTRPTKDAVEALPGTQAVYVYEDPSGAPCLLVRRYLPAEGAKKKFAQYVYAGDGRWELGVPKDVQLYPWRVRDIMAASRAGRTIYVAEGEKCVLALERLRMLATCNPMGAGKWLRDGSDYAAALNGAGRVVIFSDPDETGRKHAHTIAQSLYGRVGEIVVLEVPIPDGLEGSKFDVADWVEAGGTEEQLLEIIARTPQWVPDAATLEAAAAANEDQLHCTDLGNAQRLVRKHGDSIRYCASIGWLVWDGRRMRIDDIGGIDRCAQKTAMSIHVEATRSGLSKSQRKKLNDWAFMSESVGRLSAMTRVAQPMVTVEPDDLDRDPFLLNVENGTLHLATGELRPADQADLITKTAPVTYDPAATCPTWERFLHRIMDGNETLVRFLQRVVGYSLTGSVAEECCFVLFGHGRNGKSTFIETIASMLGPDFARKLPSELLLDAAKPNSGGPTPELARLKGARFAFASEVEEGRRLKEAFLKETTGRDTITARYMHSNPFEFMPSHKLFYAVNHKPKIQGTDEGIWARIHLVPFTVFIPPEERDPHLRDKLRAELSGILNWALAGCLEWQRARLQPPDEVQAATQEYRQESDNVNEFLVECCDVGTQFQVTVKTLYTAYVRWCEQNSYRAMGKRTMNDYLTDRGFPSREGAGGMRVRTGLCIRPESYSDHG